MAGRVSWTFKRAGAVVSTQLVARELARKGGCEGVVVVASSQTDGRGRKDRRWVSPRGGLYMSVILRPKRATGIQQLALVGAFAVAEGIRKDTGLIPYVRWPNDVTIGDKKVAGVIAESAYRGRAVSYVVLGVGINVNVRRKSLGEYAESSTSLLEELGVEADISLLRDKVLACLAPLYEQWEWGITTIGNRRGWFSTIGRRVEVTRGAEKTEYLAVDVAEDGALVVNSGDERLSIQMEEIDRVLEL